MKEGCEAKQ